MRACHEVTAVFDDPNRHSGIGLHTPASIQHGTAGEVRHQRRATLHAAYVANPARFRYRQPEPPALPPPPVLRTAARSERALQKQR